VLVNKLKTIPSSNLVLSVKASGSYQSSIDPYDWSNFDEECLMPNNVAEMIPGRSNCTACLLTATSIYLNLLPVETNNWGQIIPNHNDYHSDQMVISSTLWIPDIPNCWCQQEDMHSSILISLMWQVTYSLSYDIVSELRPVFPLAEMLLAAGIPKCQAKPFAKK